MSDPEIAVYHPLIDPDDPGLIKTAALYWDELRTIVPNSIRTPYHSAAAREAHQAGFLRPRYVSSDSPEVDRAGRELLEDNARQSVLDAVRASRAKAGLHGEKLPAWVHSDKLPGRLRDNLFGLGARPDRAGFYAVSEGFASAYMTRLAATVGDTDRGSPLTNHEVNHDVLLDGRAVLVAKTATSELAQMAFDTIAVQADTPVRDLVRFRERYRDQLQTFRRHLRRLARDACLASDAVQRKTVLDSIVKDDILPAREELEARLRENRIGFQRQTLEVAVGAAAGWCVSGDIPGAAVGGIVTVAFAAWNLRRNRGQLSTGEPLGYLLLAQQRFGRH